MANRKKNEAELDPTGRGRFVDQPGQLRDVTPPGVKKRLERERAKYEATYGNKAKKPANKK